jgi:hypothetical protein
MKYIRVGEISAEIQVGVGSNDVAVLEFEAIDEGPDRRQLREQVRAILVHGVPIVLLCEALMVGLREDRLALQ